MILKFIVNFLVIRTGNMYFSTTYKNTKNMISWTYLEAFWGEWTQKITKLY